MEALLIKNITHCITTIRSTLKTLFHTNCLLVTCLKKYITLGYEVNVSEWKQIDVYCN